MADTKTSDETDAAALDGSELVRLVQSAANVKTTAAVLGHQFRGAKVEMTSDDTAQNITAANTPMSFDAATFDTDSFWSAGSPTRLTIPAGLGITHVELTGMVVSASTTADTWMTLVIRHYNSGATLLRQVGNVSTERGSTTTTLNVSTGPMAVSDGDYFDLSAREESDTSITISGTGTLVTFFAIKVIGMEPV